MEATSFLYSKSIHIQPKLEINTPGDRYEQEADAMAERIMRMPSNNVEPKSVTGLIGNSVQRKCTACEEEDKKKVMRKTEGQGYGIQASPSLVSSINASRGGGSLLPGATRSFMENAFSTDFSRVRVHTDSVASEMSKGINAKAFTTGSDIYFKGGEYQPGTDGGKRLLAHELTHVVQQGMAGQNSHAKSGTESLQNLAIEHQAPVGYLQRKLILTGTPPEIQDFIGICETASGLILTLDPATHELTATGSSAVPATSPSFARDFTNIVNDPVQNAEINAGSNQPQVWIGAFPTPHDLTGGGVQNVDMDDIDAMEAGAPGVGLADLLHEIVENYHAHATAPVLNHDLFPDAHEAGLQAEANVVADTVGSGRRVASARQPTGPNVIQVAEDYDAYYVLSTLTGQAGGGVSVSNVSIVPKVVLITQTVEGFSNDSDAFPAAGAAAVAAVVLALTNNPLATVRIEGFTDNIGSAAHNIALSSQRAVAAAQQLAGIASGRVQTVGRGETGFIAPNNTEANRARNRHVIYTVTVPVP